MQQNTNIMCKYLTGLVLISLLGCDSGTDPGRVVASVEISPSANTALGLQLHTAEELQLHAQVSHADGSIASDVPITWHSSAPQLATVDATGLLRTAATYSACGVFQVPFGCAVDITATAGDKADTVAVLVQPRIDVEGTPAVTLLVGDSTAVAAPVAKVDGEIRCTFFLATVGPQQVAQRTASGYILGVASGQASAAWMPNQNLCQSMTYSTAISVLPR